MKKGISLIVLVITIIVMIIIAGAIILSLSSSNVTGKANWATLSSDRANLQAEYAVILADFLAQKDYSTNETLTITMSDLALEENYIAWAGRVTAAEFTTNAASITDPAMLQVMYTGTAVTGAPTVTPVWYTPSN